MKSDEENNVQPLVEFESKEIETHSAFEVLANVREENAWLANFSSDNTKQAYRRAVASFVATIGISSADELYAVQQSHVLAWRASMEQAGLSRRTIAARLAALSSLYRQLTDKQLVSANPVAGVRRPKTKSAGVGAGASPTLTTRQVKKMIAAPNTKTLQGLRDRALLMVFFFMGSRCSEPTTLKVKDFYRDSHYTILRFTVKGGKEHPVPVNPKCAEAITEYLTAAGHGDQADAFLFQPVKNGKPGNPMTRGQFYRLFAKYGKAIGLERPPYPHMARATMITRGFELERPAEQIQRSVAHSSVTTTEGYNHTTAKKEESLSLFLDY